MATNSYSLDLCSKDEVIEIVRKEANLAYPPEDYSDPLATNVISEDEILSWWTKNKYSFIALKRLDGKEIRIIGAISILSLEESFLDVLIQGKKREKDIEAEHILTYEASLRRFRTNVALNKPCRFYVGGILSFEDKKDPSGGVIVRRLFASIYSYLMTFEQARIEIYAKASSPDGEATLQLIGRTNEHGTKFLREITSANDADDGFAIYRLDYSKLIHSDIFIRPSLDSVELAFLEKIRAQVKEGRVDD